MIRSRIVRLGSFCLLTLAVVCGSAGCALPEPQLRSYTEAMSAAREAGEQILLDHAAAEVTFQKIKETRIARSPARHTEDIRLAFSAEAIAVQPADAVLARIQAWEVLSRYGDALVAIAEGRSAEEVEGAVGALLKAVSTLSLEAAAEMAPFAGVLNLGIQQMQRAIEAREFREAVAAGDGLVAELSSMLIQDANDFYAVRLGIRSFEYSRRTDQIADARGRLVECLWSGALMDEYDSESAEIIKQRFDAAVMSLPDWQDEHLLELPESRRTVSTPLSTSVIETELINVERWASEAVRIDAALLEYRAALSSYVLLVHQMRATHAALAAATKDSAASLPPPAEIVRTVVSVRRSISAYRELQ